MIDEKMEELRQRLNSMLESEDADKNDVLRTSRELDELIVNSIKIDLKKGVKDKASKEPLIAATETILDKLKFFRKLYESVRVVDPVSKKILSIKDNSIMEIGAVCYNFWKKEKLCDNCISMRAFIEDDAVIKIEKTIDDAYMITAVPIQVNDSRFIVEMLKNLKSSFFLDTNIKSEENDVVQLINDANRLAVKDALTEVYNRRYINERLPVDLFNASAANEPLSIIFTDIDHFKNINDTYGHSIGDKVLIEFVRVIEQCIRRNEDWIARYGGEEFFICLSSTDNEEAKKVAERMRCCVESKEFLVEGNLIHITSSFGVYTVFMGDECLTVDGIIELVDKRMYQAKKCGRNRVV